MLKWFTSCMECCLLALNTYRWPQVNLYADEMSGVALAIWNALLVGFAFDLSLWFALKCAEGMHTVQNMAMMPQ